MFKHIPIIKLYSGKFSEQEKVAEQQRGLLQKDSHCGPLSAAQLLKRSFGQIFSISPEASPCEKYYRAVNVDPFLDVPPTMV